MTESLKHGADKAGSAAEAAASSTALVVLARVGLVAYGIVNVLIGYVALKIAFGGGGSGDQSGALATLADDAIGVVLLWVIVVGLFALAIWLLSDGIWGYRNESGTKQLRHRVTSAGKGVVFAALAVSCIGFATGGGSSDAQQQQEQTSGVMSLPFGQILVVIVGAIVIVVGVVQVVQGFQKKFREHLNKGMAKPVRATVEKIGVFGFVADGVALILVGVLLAYAALTFDPAKATGLDGAMRLVATAPFGQILLALVALGFLAYGVFQFARARYEEL